MFLISIVASSFFTAVKVWKTGTFFVTCFWVINLLFEQTKEKKSKLNIQCKYPMQTLYVIYASVLTTTRLTIYLAGRKQSLCQKVQSSHTQQGATLPLREPENVQLIWNQTNIEQSISQEWLSGVGQMQSQVAQVRWHAGNPGGDYGPLPNDHRQEHSQWTI